MKIFEVLKKLDEQKKYYESLDMIKETVETEKIKNKLSQFVNSEVLSKRDANKQWEIAGNNINEYIDKIISLLSLIASKSREELEEFYDTNKLKTIYYLIHNSNLKLNGIAEGMHKSKVGYIPQYHSRNKIKGTNQSVRLKDEEANTDLYHLLMNYLLYERSDLVEGLYEFFVNPSYKLSPSLIEHDFKVYNNIYTELFNSIPSNIFPEDLYKAIANMHGNASITRSNFEFLFTLLFDGGKFEKMPSEKEILKLQTAGKDYNRGDIKIGNKAIEIKVDTGSGGGRIGRQPGFNDAEGIMSEYQAAVKDLIKFVKDTFESQIPTDAIGVKDNFELIIQKYSSDNLQLNLVPREGKWESYDNALLQIARAVQKIIPDLRMVDSGIKLTEKIKEVYIKGWQSLILNKKFQTSVKSIITSFLEGRSITDMLNDGFIINPDNFQIMGQAIAFLELSFYAAEKRFNYIFVIKCDKSFNSPKMMILSNNKIQLVAKEISEGNFQSLNEILKNGLLFDLPATYKTASRAVRPAITLT